MYYIGATWRIRLNYPCSAAAMRAVATVTLATCLNDATNAAPHGDRSMTADYCDVTPPY